jgi:cell fate regulator YaaT (PSP1 superfamily)
MACTSCGTKEGGTPGGCKSNGTCGTSGCNALNVYDWFKDMDLPSGYKPFNVVEVRFKGSRKEFFRNTNNLELYTGDYVCVDSSIGFDIGTVSATGEIVRLQLKKYRVREDSDEMRGIQRVASERDMERQKEAKSKEDQTLERARTIAFSLNLQMKISDIEIQGDGRKAIFFYTAETRVDFRELIKRYADEFKLKIEMRHISYREEASRLGGTGVCGRELCCSTWLTDYKQVNTGAARVQNLSINMEKLAGQCGRLKCCLNYELDQYVEAIDAFPKAKVVKLDTVAGVAYARKTDILKKLMWFSYDDNQTWVALPVDKVNEVMEENKGGKQSASLQDLAPASAVLEKVGTTMEDRNNDFIGNSELLSDDEFALKKRGPERGDQRNGDRRKGGNDRRPENRGPRPAGENRGPRPENRGPRPEGGPRPAGENRGPRPDNRGPRPEGGPRPAGENRGPRPDNRGPRPEGGPRPAGENRGPRPENRGPRPEGGPRPAGENRGPRPENRGPRPEGGPRPAGENRGPRPENRGPRPEGGPRPAGENRGPRPDNRGPRPVNGPKLNTDSPNSNTGDSPKSE